VTISEHGEVYRDGGVVVVRAQGNTYVEGRPGVVCLNPEAEPQNRIYEKRFPGMPVYLPDEIDEAMAHIIGPEVIVWGFNGYSALNDERLTRWGIQRGMYEALLRESMIYAYRQKKQESPAVEIAFTHGSSGMDGGGVDWVSINVAKELGARQLGHSCPKFMFYVDVDPEVPVLVGRNKDEYTRNFNQALDIMFTANGSKHTFTQDIAVCLEEQKPVVPLDIIGSVSTTGGPMAIAPNGTIDCAITAFAMLYKGLAFNYDGPQEGHHAFNMQLVLDHTRQICRQKLPPEVLFAEENNDEEESPDGEE